MTALPAPLVAPRVDVHLDERDLPQLLAADARTGLSMSPKRLSPMWLYDDVGCALFDAITELDEYYPTRTERGILAAHADDVASLGWDTLVELGSGTSEKTTLLLDALARRGCLQRFVPFDVSESTVRAASARLAARYPGVAVHAVVGDFQHHLSRLPEGGRRLVAFLGSTIGNLLPEERHRLLRELSSGLAAGDALLLGVDLVKDARRLEAAYNDGEGITAAFTSNALTRLNRELGGDADPASFEPFACWDGGQEWVELGLRSMTAQRVQFEVIGLEVEFERGEVLRTEVSTKFRRSGLEAELRDVGLRVGEWWTDDRDDFAVLLATSIQ